MATKDPENDEVHKNVEMIDRDRELSQKWKCKELISSSLWKKDKESSGRKAKELNGNADVKKVSHSSPIGIDLNYWRRSRSRLRLCSNGKDFLELLSLHKSRSRSIDMRSRDAFSQLKWNNNHMNNLYSRCIQNQTIQTNHAQIWKGVDRVPVPVPVDPSSPSRVRVQVKNNNTNSKGGSQLKKKNKVKTKTKTKEEVEEKASALSQDVGVEAHPCNSICGIRRGQHFKPSCSKIMEIWKYAEQVDNWTSTKGQKQTQTCRVNNVSRGTRTNSVISPLAASLTFQSVKIPKIYDPYNKNILFRQLYEEQIKDQTLPQETTPKIAPKSDAGAGMTPSLSNSNIIEEVKFQPNNPSPITTPTQRQHEKLINYDYDYNPFETPKKSYASKSDVITSVRDEYYQSDIMDDYDYTDSDEENQADDPGSSQTHIDLLLRLPKKEFLEEIQHLEEEDLKFSVVADDVSFAPVRGWTSFPQLHDRFNPSNKQHLSPYPTTSTLTSTSTSTSTMTDDQLWRSWAEDQLHLTKALELSQNQQPISTSRMFNRQNRFGKALPRQFQLSSGYSNSKLTPDPDTIARVNINVNESVSACAQAQASTDYWSSCYNNRDTDDTDLTDCSTDINGRFKLQDNPEDFTDLMSSCKTVNKYNSCSSNHSSENNNEDNPHTMFTKDEDDLRLLSGSGSGSGFGQIPGLGPDFGFGENQNVYEVMKRSRSKQRGDEPKPKPKPKNRSKSKSRTRALSCDSLISISNSSRSQSSSTEHLHKISPAFNLHLLRPAQHHHPHQHGHGQEGSKEVRTAANSKREQDESQKNQQYSSNAFHQRPPRRSRSRSQKRKRSRTRNSHIGFAIGGMGRENGSRLNLQSNNSEINQIRSGLMNSGIDEEVELEGSKILSLERDTKAKAQETEETEKRGKLSHSSNKWLTEAEELNEEVSNCVEGNSEENCTANLITPHECDSIFGLMRMQEELNRLNSEKRHFPKSQSSHNNNGFLPTTILDLKELATLWSLAHDTQDRGCDPDSDPDLDHETPSPVPVPVLEDQSIMSKFKSKKRSRRPENFMRRSPKYFPWGFSKIANGRKGQQSQFQGQGQCQGQVKTPPPVPPPGVMLSLKRCMAQWFDKRCHFA